LFTDREDEAFGSHPRRDGPHGHRVRQFRPHPRLLPLVAPPVLGVVAGVHHGPPRHAALPERVGLAAELHAPRVTGLVRPDNLPSRRALERLGLSLDGELDDFPGQAPSLLYRISAPDNPGSG